LVPSLAEPPDEGPDVDTGQDGDARGGEIVLKAARRPEVFDEEPLHLRPPRLAEVR